MPIIFSKQMEERASRFHAPRCPPQSTSCFRGAVPLAERALDLGPGPLFREGEAIEVKAWLWSLVCAKSEAFLTTDAKLKWWTPEGLRELIPFFNITALRSEQKPMRHDEPCWLRPSLGWRTAQSPGLVTHTHIASCAGPRCHCHCQSWQGLGSWFGGVTSRAGAAESFASLRARLSAAFRLEAGEGEGSRSG